VVLALKDPSLNIPVADLQFLLRPGDGIRGEAVVGSDEDDGD